MHNCMTFLTKKIWTALCAFCLFVCCIVMFICLAFVVVAVVLLFVNLFVCLFVCLSGAFIFVFFYLFFFVVVVFCLVIKSVAVNHWFCCFCAFYLVLQCSGSRVKYNRPKRAVSFLFLPRKTRTKKSVHKAGAPTRVVFSRGLRVEALRVPPTGFFKKKKKIRKLMWRLLI